MPSSAGRARRPTRQAPELLELTSPILEEARVKEEAELIERWREQAGRGERAASGWDETLEAASDERVEALLYQDGAEHEAAQCPACGRLSVGAGPCPLDGTQMERRDEGLDLAVRQVIAHSGTAHALPPIEISNPSKGSARSCDTRSQKWLLSRARFSKST